MLTHITIKNFTIVRELTLDFQSGLHVLTGETGAGKSIWIDAIQIGLGERTDSKIIYPGEMSCDITLCFDLSQIPSAKKWLSEHDLPNDDCIIRRVIEHDKPSRTTINGIPMPQHWARDFSEFILCIHGQHQHQLLLKTEHQRNLIDRYAKNENLLLQLHTCYEKYKSVDRDYQALALKMQNKASDLSLFHYQLNELQQLAIQENEYDILFSQYQQLHRLKQFSASLNHIQLLLSQEDGPNASRFATQALQEMERMPANDEKLEEIKSLLHTAVIHLDEARNSLEQYCDESNFSAEKLTACENRLAILQDIARKHHVDPTQLNDIENDLAQKIEQLEKADELLSDFDYQKKMIMTEYNAIADTLTERRKNAAKKLSAQVTADMQTLGMNGGAFNVVLDKHANDLTAYGNESIHFLIATNPGQAPHALSQIVSGGELSRLSLIIQVLTAEKQNTPTLIFDEVDVGIGGKTADLVGDLLQTLARSAQVLCVTHLPQVAAKAHHHYQAEKITAKKSVSTHIRTLNPTERTKELARMLSGATITEKSLQHAKELLTT